VDEYVIQYFANPTTMYMAMEVGDIDINCAIGESDYKRFLNEGGDGFEIVRKPSGIVSHFDFGYICNEAWYDKRVRQAIAYGVPWDEFGELAYGDLYYPATSFATHDSPLYENVGRYEYDLEKAQALLAEAGYAPGELKIVTYMQDTPASITQGEALKFYLDQIGFDSEFTFTSTWGQMLPTTDIEFGIHSNARGSGTRNPTASLNMAGIKSLPFLYIDDAKFQELYVPLAESFDQPASERMELAKELQQYVFDECLVIPIAETQILVGYRTEYLSGQQVMDATLTSQNVYLSKLALKENYGK
jgi:peptide/nickel transport system substrate-binding protein